MFDEAIKKWLSALGKNDYRTADEQFPLVVRGALQNAINNRKPAVVEKLNADAEKIASDASKLADESKK